MARTDNEDTADAIAADLLAGYAFGVEFVELGLGDDEEQRAAARSTTSGVSTATPSCRRRPRRPGCRAAPRFGRRVVHRRLVPAPCGRPHRRAGHRHLDGVPVELASAHLENRTDAGHRAEQMEVLLQRLDERSDGGPALVGGDFNTLGVPYADLLDRALVRRLRREEPTRFTWPVAHEPLFEVARAHGFEWTDANVAAPTTEHDAGGLPDHVPLKLDWILVRGLVARRPAVIPALACRTTMPSRSACDSRRHDRDDPPRAPRRRRRHPRRRRGRVLLRGTRDVGEELAIVRDTWSAAEDRPLIELVADEDGMVVGHLQAAPGPLDGAPTPVAGVAPVCVGAAHQGRGVGSALMAALVGAAEERRWPLLVLLGDPAYYERFGFEPAAPLGLSYPPVGATNPHFQARQTPRLHRGVARGVQLLLGVGL